MEILSKFILWAKISIVLLTIFTIWASAHRGKLEERKESRLNQQVVRLGKDLSESQEKLAELQPRFMSLEQQELLSNFLKNSVNVIKKIIVTAANSNNEAQRYATEFVRLFKTLGYESDLNLPIPGLRPETVGMHIGVRNLQNIPEGARILSEALLNAGIKCAISRIEENFFTGASFLLIIGSKP